jgi:hypothetical protein
MLIIAATILFAITAFSGLMLAILHTMREPRPWALTITHGLLAASALALLGGAVVVTRLSALKLSLILFVVAASGGLFLLSYRIRSKPLPTPALLAHVLAAVAGFVALVLTFGAIKL